MKKKIIYSISLTISLICLSISIFFNFTYSPFDSDNVKNNIAIFSSQTYDGRLPGSDGNSLVGEQIRISFQNAKLTPLNESYTEDFNTLCPVPSNTTPYIQFLSNDKTIESLKYGVDFKEDMLNFRKNNINFSKSDKVNIYTNYIDVMTPTGNCLLYVSQKDNLSFRSSFSSNYSYDMVIMITTKTYNKIIDSLKNDLTISVSLPFKTEEKTISNIVGVLKGKSSELPPLILTAHYDHLGKDGLSNIYSGALDNASGTSFLLELQRSLSTFGKPKRDIIFVALNAEEFGLLGSKAFAEKNFNKIKEAEVINFDMIGSSGFPITFMQGVSFKEKNSLLLSSVEKIAKKKDVKTEVVYQDSSDHASFNNLGIDSLSFCHSDMTKIHTPNDTYNFIDTAAIDSAYSVIDAKIKSSSYSYFTLFLYNKYSLFLFSIIFGFLISAPFITGIKRKSIKCKNF